MLNTLCRKSDPSGDEEDLSLLTPQEREERRSFEQKEGPRQLQLLIHRFTDKMSK
jgi:hypothetical protein